LRATSGRVCSAACRLFFEGHALPAEEAPNSVIADHHATFGQLGLDRPGTVRNFVFGPGIMGKKEISHGPTQRAVDI
jgi:hypothetical protein